MLASPPRASAASPARWCHDNKSTCLTGWLWWVSAWAKHWALFFLMSVTHLAFKSQCDIFVKNLLLFHLIVISWESPVLFAFISSSLKCRKSQMLPHSPAIKFTQINVRNLEQRLAKNMCLIKVSYRCPQAEAIKVPSKTSWESWVCFLPGEDCSRRLLGRGRNKLCYISIFFQSEFNLYSSKNCCGFFFSFSFLFLSLLYSFFHQVLERRLYSQPASVWTLPPPYLIVSEASRLIFLILSFLFCELGCTNPLHQTQRLNKRKEPVALIICVTLHLYDSWPIHCR